MPSFIVNLPARRKSRPIAGCREQKSNHHKDRGGAPQKNGIEKVGTQAEQLNDPLVPAPRVHPLLMWLLVWFE
jgi:hypothetical protein